MDQNQRFSMRDHEGHCPSRPPRSSPQKGDHVIPGQAQSSVSQEMQRRIMLQPADSPTRRHFDLGQAIARMYIAAQGVDALASDAACQAMSDATTSCRIGFDSVIRESGYNVTALNPDQG